LSTLGLQGLSAVEAPPAIPPAVGLIATCQQLGVGTYLIDDVEESVDDVLQDSQGNLLANPQTLDQRWVFGYRWLPEQTCALGSTRDPCADTQLNIPTISGFGSLNASPTDTGSTSWEVGIPAIVETGDNCSAFGWEAHNYRQRAVRALLAVESYQAAYEFWTGTVARGSSWDNQYLQAGWDTASGAVHNVTPSGTPQTPGAALALIEQAIAVHSNGQPAAIHCTRQVGAALSELGNTFRNVNGLIYTYMGNVIIPDAGYPGTGANGESIGADQYMFATGLPVVRRSPITVIPDTFGEAIDKTHNFIEFRAMRMIGVTIPPCPLVAVEVALQIPS
jgi:hypothetical protein